jgi:TonB family protein
MRKLFLPVLLLGILFSPAAAAQQPPAPLQDTAAPQITIPAYPDSPDGLKQLVTIMVEATKNNDQKTIAACAQLLRLPDPLAWFKLVFGDQLGSDIADAHHAFRDHLDATLFESLTAILKDDLPELRAFRFEKPCEPEISERIYQVLLARRHPVPFYLAMFTKKKETSGRAMGFFVYVDGAFRYLGLIRLAGLRFPSDKSGVRVGGNVQQAKLQKMARPVYPTEAKNLFLQGTVRLEAVIGIEGEIYNLRVVSGPCVLAESAIRAVRQWRYAPTLLNGQPVPVLTTIDVVFALGR